VGKTGQTDRQTATVLAGLLHTTINPITHKPVECISGSVIMADRTKKRDPGKITKIVKCGVVGDGTVGKTTLLLSYITQAFITEYTPTVFDNFSAIEEINDEVINVILWDTAGMHQHILLILT
jgi:hypothetical protein